MVLTVRQVILFEAISSAIGINYFRFNNTFYHHKIWFDERILTITTLCQAQYIKYKEIN